MTENRDQIRTSEELEGLIGKPSERVRNKVRTELTDADLRWLAASPFCVLATSDDEGRCDASPKGDPAGSLVHVLDRRTVAIAERPGNRRVDGYYNILANPHVGMVFLVPGRSDTLRVNGRAHLVHEAPWFEDLAVRAVRPVLAAVGAMIRTCGWSSAGGREEAHLPEDDLKPREV